MSFVIFGSGFFITILTALGISAGGWSSWVGLLILFGVIPALELLFPNWQRSSAIANSRLSDFWLWLSPLYLGGLLVTSGISFLNSTVLLDQIGIVLSTGAILGAFGITYAHELVHRASAFERALGVMNLTLVNFSHWGVEHVFGHHKNVGTPEDGATARMNQSLYSFWFQDYFQGLKHSWIFESTRLRNSGKSFLRHRIALYVMTSFALTLALWLAWGFQAVIYWWSVSIVATLLLLTVDYIEHYGLSRNKKENGIYEPVKPQHSWDTASWPTNAVLVNLGLHSHHHMKARLPFQQLEMQSGAKIMPYGYSVMVALALVPPLFFKIMNPRLLDR